MKTATAVPTAPDLSDRDLNVIARLVYQHSGITLHAGKRALVTARLQKRLTQGGFRSFREYLRHVQADASGTELTLLLDAIATNHTALFREPQHFAFLRDVVIPTLAARPAQCPIVGWSAACATGEEPYSIAMTVSDCLGEDARARVRLLASDLSTRALATAKAGVYKAERVANLPDATLRKYFEWGTGTKHGFVRVNGRLRRLVEFHHINLLEAVPFRCAFDFIFCRNVMIYFDEAAQQRAVELLEAELAPGGYLFISHAESLNGIRHGLRWIGPAIYQRVSR